MKMFTVAQRFPCYSKSRLNLEFPGVLAGDAAAPVDNPASYSSNEQKRKYSFFLQPAVFRWSFGMRNGNLLSEASRAKLRCSGDMGLKGKENISTFDPVLLNIIPERDGENLSVSGIRIIPLEMVI